MSNANQIDILNQNFPMIGLSADWIFQTWLISGSKNNGVVIFENEDRECYEVIEFHYENEDRHEKTLFSGELKDVKDYSINRLNICF
ncbi:hypothetical protein [Aeromonas allosaccharophila]|uniref:hypothetical protein n=1 Tax=Aeromonas allosaccharophila TaxID=656 RepID=UPI0030052D14